jgi:hypothetical protein
MNDCCPEGVQFLCTSVTSVVKLLFLWFLATDGQSPLKMNFIFKISDAILSFHAAEAHR